MKYLIIFLFTFYPLTIMSEDSESDLTLIPNKNSLAEAKYDMGIAYGGEPGGGNGYAYI